MGIGPGTALHSATTYWAPNPDRDDFNETTYAVPVLLKGRWVELNQEVMIPSGETITSSTQVYLNADVVIRGFLAEGDYTGSNDPHTVAGVREIQAFGRFPDLRNMHQQRKAYL